MRIAHYCPYLLGPESGTANSARAWSEAQSRAGAQVTVLVDDAIDERQEPQGTTCRRVPHVYSGRWRIPRGLRADLGGTDVLVVHGGWTLWNIVACRAAKETGVPYIVTTHGVYYPRVLDRGAATKRIWNTLLERRHLEGARALHVFFKEEQPGLDRLGVTTSALTVPNGMDHDPDHAWDGGTGGYLLWLGRFDPEVKGLDLLVDSFLHLSASERPQLRLHGPDWKKGRDHVRSLISARRLDRWIKVFDPIYGEEKRRLIARAQGCVYPSRWDASPMAVAEAVASGVPTLVADYPLGTLLASKGAALMCDRSPRGIAEGIRALVSDRGLHVARRGRDLATGELSWANVTQRFLDGLSTLIA